MKIKNSINEFKIKFLNILEFYKSVFFINLVLSILASLFSGISGFNIIFLLIGFVLGISVKEINNKNEYFFYYNNNLSKIQLLIYSYFLNFLIVVFINFLNFLI